MKWNGGGGRERLALADRWAMTCETSGLILSITPETRTRPSKNLSRIPRVVVFPFFNSEMPTMKRARARAQQRQRLLMLLR